MGQQLFSNHIYGTRTFLTENKNCSEGSWQLYLSGKNDTSGTILLKPRCHKCDQRTYIALRAKYVLPEVIASERNVYFL